MTTRRVLALLLAFAACSSNGSSGPVDGPAGVPDARDGSTGTPDTPGVASDGPVGASDGPGGTSDGPGGISDGAGDSGDGPGAASRAFRVVFESNGSATPGGGAVIRGGAGFRLPPQASQLVLAGIEVLSDGDSPPGSFGGGGVSLEISRGGLPFAAGTTRLTRKWLGTCDGRPARPCWTGPTFDPPVVIEAGEQNVFVTIDRLGGEGGVFMLPIAGTATASQKQESWGRGGIRWTQGGQFENHTTWTRAPADQPWIFRLLTAK